MAQPTNLLDRYDLSSTFEDLSDMIYNVDPVDTMFMTMAKREKSENIMKEWNVDALSDASDNYAIDGDDFSGSALTSATKLNNYHQISRKDLVVSRRADIVNKPGRRSEVAYQIMKEMKTLKNSVEIACLKRKVGVVGTSTTAGQIAGVPAWIRTNTSMGASGVAPTLVSGRPGAAGTPGTSRGLTESQILKAKQNTYDKAEGKANWLLVSPQLKRGISGYLFANSAARIAAPQQDFGKAPGGAATVMGSVQFWQTDFGTVKIVPSRHIPHAEVLLLDPEYWAVSYLTGFVTDDIPRNGDSRRKMLLVDFTVCSKNEKASAVIAAIDQATAVAA